MSSLLGAATLIATTAFAQVETNEDDLALIRADTTKKKQPLSIWIYKNNGPSITDFMGDLRASDIKIKRAFLGGKSPVRWIFPADWDGDGIDEIAIVRERTKKKDRRLELRIHPQPTEIWDKIDKPLIRSKKKDLGFAEGEGKVIAVGAVDQDGDGDDELALVKEHVWGARFLEIRQMPPGNKKAMGNPIASDLDFGGQAGLVEIVSLWGRDVDSDGVDELFVLSRSVSGVERIDVYTTPATLFADTGLPIRSFDNANGEDGFENFSASRIFLKDNGPVPAGGDHYIVFGQTDPNTQTQRVAVYPEPLLAGIPNLPPFLVRDDTPGFDGTPGLDDPGLPIVGAFGMRFNPPPPPPPPPDISGQFTITFNAQDTTGTVVNLGPFSGVTAQVGQQQGVFQWIVNIPGLQAITGIVQDPTIQDGSLIQLPSLPANPGTNPGDLPPYYCFPVSTSSGPAAPGDTIQFPGLAVQITAGTPLLISGSDGFCTVGSTQGSCTVDTTPPACGALLDGTTGAVKAWIQGVTFSKL